MDGWLKIRAAAQHAGVSPRTFRDWLHSGNLKHSRLPTGTILVQTSAIDTYLKKFDCHAADGVRDIVEDVVSQIGGRR